MKIINKSKAKSFALKSFGGLTKEYYFRNFLFGLAIFILMKTSLGNQPYSFYLFFIPTVLLYPYSRFVYESITNFVLGNNTFFVDLKLLFLVKIFSMLLCFVFAIMIAPLGLIYLYFFHTHKEGKNNNQGDEMNAVFMNKINDELDRIRVLNSQKELSKEILHHELMKNKNLVPAYLQCFDIYLSTINNFNDLEQNIERANQFSHVVEISDYVPEEHLYVERTNKVRPK